MEERTFATISKESVKLFGESVGISSLQDDAAAVLGEDANYRLREVVMKSTAYMRSAKRRRLCPEDFNQALRDMNVQPVFGHGALTDTAPFRQTKEGELHFIEENEVNFNNTVWNSYVPKHLGETSIKAQWMALEGVNKFSSSSHNAHLQQISKNMKRESSAEVLEYYTIISKALSGARPVLVQRALKNLSENKRVQTVLPYLVNFVTNGVKMVNHDVNKLTVLMKTVAALLKNKMVFLGMQPYLRLVVQAVETCLLEPLASYGSHQSADHWTMRNLAATVLAYIVRKWGSPVNRIKTSVMNKLSETVQDLSRPLCSHYGAVVGLMALGCAEVEAVLVPHLVPLMEHLQAIASSTEEARPTHSTVCTQRDATTVLKAIQLAMETLLRAYMGSEDLKGADPHRDRDGKKSTSAASPPPPSQDSGVAPSALRATGLEVLRLYQQLSDSLGDSLAARLPVMDLERVFRRQPSTQLISLGDPDSKRSGEELLADLMRQVQQEEEQEQQRRRVQQQQMLMEQQGSLFEGHQEVDVDRELRELVAAAANSCQPTAPGQQQQGPGFQDMAVSSTISDPSRGTLKLKIKRHPGQASPSFSRQGHSSQGSPSFSRQGNHGQGSPSLSRQGHHSQGSPSLSRQGHPGQGSPSMSRQGHGARDAADSPQQLQGREPAKDPRSVKRKRKQQLARSPWEQEFGELEGFSDLEDPLSHSGLGQFPRAYSPGPEGSGSDSTLSKKGKLMLKLKVPSRDSPSD